jgi:hypothetical protein
MPAAAVLDAAEDLKLYECDGLTAYRHRRGRAPVCATARALLSSGALIWFNLYDFWNGPSH